MQGDPRKYAPAASRNKQPILALLERIFPGRGHILEIASGTGEHASFFSRQLAQMTWQPSEYDTGLLASIDAHGFFDKAENLLPAIHLDVTRTPWPTSGFDAILNCNMIHIAPWEVCQGLMSGARQVLNHGGILMLYGPFKRKGHHLAESNKAFDTGLRARDARWGVRDLEKVIAEAAINGFDRQEIVEMPANNLSVIFRLKDQGAGGNTPRNRP